VLFTLTLSGNPVLTYYTSSFTYNLSNLTLTGADQYGNPYSLTGLPVTWNVTSGPATVSGNTLTINGSGQVVVTASITTDSTGTVTSNPLTLNVVQALSPPTKFSQTGATTSQISVSWSSETGAASYDLYQNGTYITNVSGTTYTYSGLSVGTSYTLAVCAIDSRGVLGEQASMTGDTLTAAPTVSLGVVTGSSIQVTWNSLTGASYYNAYIWNGSSWTQNNTSNITATNYTFSGLAAATTYTFGIAGVNGAKEPGAYGQISATTPGILTYSTPGTSYFTTPAGVSQVIVAVIGGGGGGAGSSGSYGSAGGGSGGVALTVLTVTPNQQLTVSVGSGGAGGAGGSSPASGSAGSASSVSGSGINTVTANGGSGGTPSSTNGYSSGTGGSTGSITNATFRGGAAGCSPWGTNGEYEYGGAGGNAQFGYGHGGSGATYGSQSGSVGGNGAVIIRW
jgi:hypothetical protein